jgi:hypothetical protein
MTFVMTDPQLQEKDRQGRKDMRVPKEILAIEAAVRKENGEAETRLRDKCNWEHMSRTAVIMNWGDPRTWPATQTAKLQEGGK